MWSTTFCSSSPRPPRSAPLSLPMISFVPAAVGAAADEKKAKRKALMKVQRWVEDALPEEYEAWVVMASELRCYVPGCAPLETSVSLLDPASSSAAPGGSRAFKVFKPAVEVEKDEALAALAQALSDEAKEPNSRQLAGLQLKNMLTARDEALKADKALRWLALDAAMRAPIKTCAMGALASPAPQAAACAARNLANNSAASGVLGSFACNAW